MPFDTSMYKGDSGFIQGMTQGYNLVSGMQDRKEQKELRDMQKQGLALDQQAKQMDMVARVLGTVKDQESYDKGVATLEGMGLDVGQYKGQTHSKDLIDVVRNRALTAKDQAQIALQNKELENQRIAAGAKSKKESFKLASDLRKERSGRETTKATRALTTSLEKIEQSVLNPSAAGDLSMIFNYMKMLDPQSVVRESEFRSAEGARAALARAHEKGEKVPAFLLQGLQKLETGQFLLPEQRADFYNQSFGLYDRQQGLQDQVDKEYLGIADRQKLNPKDVLGRLERKSPLTMQQIQAAAQKSRKKTGGGLLDPLMPEAQADDSMPIFSGKDLGFD